MTLWQLSDNLIILRYLCGSFKGALKCLEDLATHLRLHRGKIGVCVPTGIVCKPSMLTRIKYTFSESLLNTDSIFCILL